MEGWAGPGTPRQALVHHDSSNPNASRDILILIGIQCGVPISRLCIAIRTSRGTINKVRAKYKFHLKPIKPDPKIQAKLFELSHTQQRIEIATLAVKSGLSIRLVCRVLKTCRMLIAKRTKDEDSA